MDVAFRRCGVPLYTILQVHFPVSLSFPWATSRRDWWNKGSVLDLWPTFCISKRTPLEKENEGSDRVPRGREMAQIGVCSTLQQISTDQDTLRDKKRESESEAHRVDEGRKMLGHLWPSCRRVFRRLDRTTATTRNCNITPT